MRNRFFLWTRESTLPCELVSSPCSAEYRPAEPLTGLRYLGLRYPLRLAYALDAAIPDQGLTFLVTWHLDDFDERFRDSVVILLGDEKHQIPSYAGLVRAIFKTGGIRPNPPRDLRHVAPAVAWRVALRELRNALVALRRRSRRRASGTAPMYEIPLGYFMLTEVPFIPAANRDVDVFFAGSVERDSGFTLRPRLASRRQMAAGLNAARRRLPHLRVDYTSSGPFAHPDEMLDPDTYSDRFMRAKIALCPRGNFDETLRLTEAAKSGCVAVVERLPERWYYRDAPVIQLDRWATLPRTLDSLLSDPAALERRSEQMRRWWETCLSEPAVARFIAASLAAGEGPAAPA